MPKIRRIDTAVCVVNKKHCKTCPFKPDHNGIWRNTELANVVVGRTLFKSHQLCHGTGNKTRCKGAFDHNNEIYSRMGIPYELIK